MADKEKNPAKEFLSQVKKLDTIINNKQDELTRLNGMTTKVTASWSGEVVAGSGSQDKLGDTIAKIVDLQNEINKDIDRLIGKKREVGEVIEKVQNARQIRVLYLRYFDHQTWESIACNMGLSYQGVCKIHGRALESVKKVLENAKS